MKKMSKLGSVKDMLTKEEMKKISGGYAMCCCVGGTYGHLNPNHSWSTSPGPNGCYSTCASYGASGGYWDSSSPCNYW